MSNKKKLTPMAVLLTSTIALLLMVGIPGPAWLAATLAAVAGIELCALIVMWRDRA